MKSNLKIPVHLKQFLVKQDYSLYTAIDQAAWRYIMRVSEAFFKDHAHPIYVDGLKRAGISTEKIPRISEMDEKLKKFGWRAVSVTGFIPPEIFMEMLSLQILPIACDMRNLGHIEYTPAPDIVHEAAGHAPILADPSYSSFLKRFGEIARRVIFAKEDTEVYEAVRELSEIKEDPGATEEDITDAQKKLDSAYAKVSYVSEARALTRLGWWTTEYGLFKKDDKFLIYGAGLLSSAGESYNCLSEKVKKIPLDIRCTEMDYDITKPQLQLFYTDDFRKLEATIDELASRMSYKVGGVESLRRAKTAGTVTTTLCENGLQISGVLKDFLVNANGKICLLELQGPTQLALNQRQIKGHSPAVYRKGMLCAFGDGKWPKDLKLKAGQNISLELSTGLKVEGSAFKVCRKDGTTFCVLKKFKLSLESKKLEKIKGLPLVLTFASEIPSVFGGPADRASYLKEVKSKFSKPRPPKPNITKANKDLIPLYAKVRKIRESGRLDAKNMKELESILESLDRHYSNDWLLRLEVLELVSKANGLMPIDRKVRAQLNSIMSESTPRRDLIDRGLAII